MKNFRNTEIADLIKKFRKKRNISQLELSRVCGLNNAQFFSNIERGIAEYPLDTLAVIIKYLDLSADEKLQLNKSFINFQKKMIAKIISG